MQVKDEQWIQTASSIWIPKQQRSTKRQQEPVPPQDWKAKGQPWRSKPEISQERQKFLLYQLKVQNSWKHNRYPFAEIILTRADIEWLIVQEKRKLKQQNVHEEPKWLNLQRALLNNVYLDSLPLKDACFDYAQLNGASFYKAQLENASFNGAQLEDASFNYAQLKDASFVGAQLKRVNFEDAEVERVDFGIAQLENASFNGAQLKGSSFWRAQLKGVFFEEAYLVSTIFEEAHLANNIFKNATFAEKKQGIGPTFTDVDGWNDVNLANIEWSQIKIFREEAETKEKTNTDRTVKDKWDRLNDYRIAVRAYRQLATALDAQGLKEEAERFAYRAQVMQRKSLWWRIQQDRQNIFQRVRDIEQYLFSIIMALLTGYGYRFGRSFLSYICILLMFAVLYLHISSGTQHPLRWFDASILSISDMVGRGFFRQDVSLSDPYAGWSVLEGMIGVFMDVLLISTLTQRLFKK